MCWCLFSRWRCCIWIWIWTSEFVSGMRNGFDLSLVIWRSWRRRVNSCHSQQFAEFPSIKPEHGQAVCPWIRKRIRQPTQYHDWWGRLRCYKVVWKYLTAPMPLLLWRDSYEHVVSLRLMFAPITCCRLCFLTVSTASFLLSLWKHINFHNINDASKLLRCLANDISWYCYSVGRPDTWSSLLGDFRCHTGAHARVYLLLWRDYLVAISNFSVLLYHWVDLGNSVNIVGKPATEA